MTDTDQKLFRTAQDAMIFAFNYSMQRQDRSLVDRMAAPSPRTGKGLSGNDGAAQAGMIRRELDTLSDVDLAVLTARFAPRSWPCACRAPCCSGHTPNPEYVAAVSRLMQAALPLFAGHLSNYQLRRALVEKALGAKVTIKGIATKCEVTEKTADAHWRIIRDWIGGQPKKKSKKLVQRSRVSAGNGFADVAHPDDGDDGAVRTAVDGIESAARKRADDLLSGLSFIQP